MKVNVKSAKSMTNSFRFDFGHGTTEKFYQPNVVFSMEVRKGCSMKLEMASLRRVDPMPVPPMSKVTFRTRFFYVPMIDICPYWNELDAQTPYSYATHSILDDNQPPIPGELASRSSVPYRVPILNDAVIKQLFFNKATMTYRDSQEPTEGGSNEDNSKLITQQYVELYQFKGSPSETGIPYYDGFFYAYDSTEETSYPFVYRLTERGRLLYKLLKQLGYDFSLTKEDSDISIHQDDHIYQLQISAGSYANNTAVLMYKPDYINRTTVNFSALPLLAYLKVYLNYYESSQYINNTARLKQLQSLLHIDSPGYVLGADDLDLITDLATYITYDEDYFTSAWVNPASGNIVSQALGNNFIDNTIPQGSLVGTDKNGTAVYQASNGVVTQNGLNMLKRLDQFFKRYQIAGGRMVDRILAEYGISVENSYSRRSSYIDTIETVLNISPVLDTSSETLGDYAGYGTAANDNDFIQINVPDQDGFIIAIDTVVPEVMYSQGYNRNNRHITKWDFVAASEFDAVGVQAIEQGEVLNFRDTRLYYDPANKTFGFTPRGAEYKTRYSYLTGDFSVDSVNSSISAFFTNRQFNPRNYLSSGANPEVSITASRSFVSSYDSAQYKRMFYNVDANNDYIKSIFRFKIHMQAPYRRLYEQYELNDADGNNSIDMTVGGQTLQ